MEIILIESFNKGDTVKCIFYKKFEILGFVRYKEEWQNNITYNILNKLEDKRKNLCYVGDDYSLNKICSCRLVLTEKLNKKI